MTDLATPPHGAAGSTDVDDSDAHDAESVESLDANPGDDLAASDAPGTAAEAVDDEDTSAAAGGAVGGAAVTAADVAKAVGAAPETDGPEAAAVGIESTSETAEPESPETESSEAAPAEADARTTGAAFDAADDAPRWPVANAVESTEEAVTAAGASTAALPEDAATDGVSAESAADESAAGERADATDGADEPPVAWAPVEPARKKRRVGLWAGIAAGVLVLGGAGASTILIAPGTTVAGIPVGGLLPGAAAATVADRVASFEVHVTGADGDFTVTGADLGAQIDAKALTEEAFETHPMWNVTTWFSGEDDAEIVLTPEEAHAALRAQAPSVYLDPVDATVAFDPATNLYATTPAEAGTGIDEEALTASIMDALAAGESSLALRAEATPVIPAITDDEATETAADLNALVATLGFYVGAERTVPIAPATAATWLTVDEEDGALTIAADAAEIQKSVDALPPLVNREPANAQTIVDSAGDVLETLSEGVNGRQLGDVSDLAQDFARSIEAGGANAGIAELPVTEIPFAVAALHRTIDVNLSTQVVAAVENGVVVDSWSISAGRGEWATQTGSFTVNWKLDSQNMGNQDTTQAPYYYQPDVKWVMYFNGDEALHGVYWHSNWGTPMSHGCVGMPEWRAQWLYDWSPYGTEVNVHY